MFDIAFMLIIFINSFGLTAAFTNLLIYPLKLKQRFFLYIILFICQLPSPFIGQLTAIVAVSSALFFVGLYSESRLSNLTFSALGYLIIVLLNYIVYTPLNMMGVTITMISSTPLYFIIFTALFTLLVYICTFYLGKFLRKILSSYDSLFPPQIRILFLIEVFACLFVFVYNIIQGEKYAYNSHVVYFNSLLFSVFLFITAVIFFMCLCILRKNIEILRIQKEDENLLEYMDQLERLYQEMRIFKHDYINILSTMNYYIMEGDTQNLKEYFTTQILPGSEQLTGRDFIISQLANIKITELKGILYVKLVTALNQNLCVHLEIRDEISAISMNTLDLCKVIGIFMDNAIEAAADSADKLLDIAFIQEQEYITIIITNSMKDYDINLQEIYKRDISSKRGHSGLGLFSAKEILNNCRNITHSNTMRDNNFTQILNIIPAN